MRRLKLQPIEVAGIVACAALYVVMLIIVGVRDRALDPFDALFVGVVGAVSTVLSVLLFRGVRRLLSSLKRNDR